MRGLCTEASPCCHLRAVTASSIDRSLRRSLTAGRTASGSSPTARQLLRSESSGEHAHPNRMSALFAGRVTGSGVEGCPPPCCKQLRRVRIVGAALCARAPCAEARLGPAAGRSPGAQAELDAEADAEAQEEVENLLESYFIQIDRAFNRLRSLGARPATMCTACRRAVQGRHTAPPHCLCGLQCSCHQ